jgi:hypothetical protein
MVPTEGVEAKLAVFVMVRNAHYHTMDTRDTAPLLRGV